MPGRFYQTHLPHWQPDGAIIFVTFRTKGSLPRSVIEQLRSAKAAFEKELAADPLAANTAYVHHKRLFAFYDRELAKTASDKNHSSCFLHHQKNGAALVRAIHKGQELRRFILHRYCIMPNHVHLLVEPLTYQCPESFELIAQWPPAGQQLLTKEPHPDAAPECWPLDEIMGSMKSAAAREINSLMGKRGAVFQRENFDHWIRDEQEYQRVIAYIDNNPVEAGLCSNPKEWQWGSAFLV